MSATTAMDIPIVGRFSLDRVKEAAFPELIGAGAYMGALTLNNMYGQRVPPNWFRFIGLLTGAILVGSDKVGRQGNDIGLGMMIAASTQIWSQDVIARLVAQLPKKEKEPAVPNATRNVRLTGGMTGAMNRQATENEKHYA